MNQDIEKILNTPPDTFEWWLYLVERDIDLLSEQVTHTANVSGALDKAFDALLAGMEAENGEPSDSTRTLIKKMRDFRVTEVDEQLMRIFSVLHKMHQLYRDKTP